MTKSKCRRSVPPGTSPKGWVGQRNVSGPLSVVHGSGPCWHQAAGGDRLPPCSPYSRIGRIGLPAAALALAAVAAAGTMVARLLWPPGDPEVIEHSHPDLPPGHPHWSSG